MFRMAVKRIATNLKSQRNILINEKGTDVKHVDNQHEAGLGELKEESSGVTATETADTKKQEVADLQAQISKLTTEGETLRQAIDKIPANKKSTPHYKKLVAEREQKLRACRELQARLEELRKN